MGYLKKSECVPGRQYQCRYSGKQVMCIATHKEVIVENGFGLFGARWKTELRPAVAFRYWNNSSETFEYMEVFDDQLENIKTA